MKVYLITTGEYSDYYVAAVAVNEKEAREKCASLNGERAENGGICEYYNIEVYDTEDMKVQVNGINLIFEMIVYQDSDDMKWLDVAIVTTEDLKVETEYGRRKRHIKCRAVLPDGTTKDEAKKIMLDNIAKFKAEKAGVRGGVKMGNGSECEDRVEYMFDGRQVFGFPDSPLSMANVLVNAVKKEPMDYGCKIVKKQYSKEQLKQIAKHLLLYCESEGK